MLILLARQSICLLSYIKENLDEKIEVITGISSVNKAFKAAQADAAEDDFIFVGGSSYIVADFLS